ncbi:MAG: hypothetical protein ABI420_04865 [Opitutaceae bacterium]
MAAESFHLDQTGVIDAREVLVKISPARIIGAGHRCRPIMPRSTLA